MSLTYEPSQPLTPSALADMMARRPRIDLALPYLSESYAVHPPTTSACW